MSRFERRATTIYYEEHGDGYPVLLIAPGGMLSMISMWAGATINPLTAYPEEFRLIAMDQRNSGQSVGPLDVADPWGANVDDQLALLDHLGINRCLVMGCCIGGSYAMKMIEKDPDRVVAAVLEQPIGVMDHNAHLYDTMWRSWGANLVQDRPDIDAATVEEYGTAMWNGDFVMSVSKEFIASISTPMLVLPGIDDYHPTATGREVAALAPGAELFEPWKDTPEHVELGTEAVGRFLHDHTPG